MPIIKRSDAIYREFYSHGLELKAAPRLNYKIIGTCRRFNRIRYKDIIKGY
jgi:hypothetical protein